MVNIDQNNRAPSAQSLAGYKRSGLCLRQVYNLMFVVAKAAPVPLPLITKLIFKALPTIVPLIHASFVANTTPPTSLIGNIFLAEAALEFPDTVQNDS